MTCWVQHVNIVPTGGDDLEKLNSRADYFRQRRVRFKKFSVEVECSIMDKFEKRLEEQGKTKVKWLNEKIEEELAK